MKSSRQARSQVLGSVAAAAPAAAGAPAATCVGAIPAALDAGAELATAPAMPPTAALAGRLGDVDAAATARAAFASRPAVALLTGAADGCPALATLLDSVWLLITLPHATSCRATRLRTTYSSCFIATPYGRRYLDNISHA